ncbi:cache domain-containing protein [Marinomonas foliarum]|uniref:Cache domain-containing protein n=1 Tax=Marinomonas foliarum TaxID=491950 RepID=A0A369AFT3_9GAMM|nr:cache domain-containing protein [Marinomonas foliarum]RCX08013.1 cache domain-containing protein [Marinomonas foliarum]
MEVFLSKNQSLIKRFIRGIDKYDQTLHSLSSWWGKISLIGKINSLEVASTILEDMDHTLDQFHHLQKRLIESLTNEQARKVVTQDLARCQMAIDVLIRNLFERTADIGFLSADYDVVQFLKNNDIKEEDKDFLRLRLQAYVDIYSVYQDVLLIAPDGDLVFQLSQPARNENVQDAFIQQALAKPDQYVEYFGCTSLLEGTQPNLLYANAVVDEGKVVGVIVLCFRFDNELEEITNRLLFEQEENHFLLLNGAGDVLFAPQYYKQTFPENLTISLSPKMVSLNNKKMVQVTAKGQAYQGYSGPKDWNVGSLLALETIGQETIDEHSFASFTHLTGIISADLFDIRHQSISINDDLELIVLNGIITAARKEAVEFMPVLEAIKKIGRDIDNVFADSIKSLFSTIVSGQLNSIRLQASLAVDIMDRNLYERANDCRWWSLGSQLQLALSSTKIDTASIRETLAKIHSLYTVYHTLYVYDQNGHYVAFSDDSYQDKVGLPIEKSSCGQAVFKLQDIYAYSVSAFTTFDCYGGEHTYIYNAAIRDSQDSRQTIGGIGIVFDSKHEFRAILQDILPRENGKVKAGAKAVFTTDTGFVVSSSSDDHPVGSVFWVDIDRTELQQNGSTASIIKLADKAYLVGAAKSEGYREYKRQDGYENSIVSWVLVPC